MEPYGEVPHPEEALQMWQEDWNLPVPMAMPWVMPGCAGPQYWPDPAQYAQYAISDEFAAAAYNRMRPVPQPSSSGRRRASASGSSPAGGAYWAGQQKQRFCATFPDVARCRHGGSCSFAHSRDEIQAPLLTSDEEARVPGALTENFFTERFKTLWCPVGAQHDWQTCMYAHTYQDARRPPSIGYGFQLCPYWSKKETNLPYSQRCPLGPRCPYAHGAKEQLYHPRYFRTLACRDLMRKQCPRRFLCAFHHKRSECRSPAPDEVDYGSPLKKQAVPQGWLEYFLNPPRFQDSDGGLGAVDPPLFVRAPAAAASPMWWQCGVPAFEPPPKEEAGGDTPRTQTTAGESVEADDSATVSSGPAEHGVQKGQQRALEGHANHEALINEAQEGMEMWGSMPDVDGAYVWDHYGGTTPWSGHPYVPYADMPYAYAQYGMAAGSLPAWDPVQIPHSSAAGHQAAASSGHASAAKGSSGRRKQANEVTKAHQ